MTPSEIISNVLEIKPSILDTSALLTFLNRIEAKILLLVNEKEEFLPFQFENIGTDKLILGPEHSEIYEYYLFSQIDLHSNDIASYNNYTSLYNTALIDYINYLKSRKQQTPEYKYNYKGAFK